MGRTLRIEHARVYLPFLQPMRYKGAHGGRGSGKSHAFAKLAIQKCITRPSTRIVCVREVQNSLEQSVKRLLEDTLTEFGLGESDGFRVLNSHIETPGDGIMIFQGMQNHTNDSIKSLEGYDVAWVEEAQSISERSLQLLRPTIRKETCRWCWCNSERDADATCPSVLSPDGKHLFDPSEIWLSWNPRSPKDPVDVMMRGKNKYPESITIGTTYRDNPWFPNVLLKEMEWDRQTDPDKYAHVWLGGYEIHPDSRVFKNVRVEEFVTPPNTQFQTGADWGFSIDPATLVRCFESLRNPATGELWPRKRLYIDRDLYQVGVEIDHLPSFFDGLVCGCKINPAQALTPYTMIVPPTCKAPAEHGCMRRWPIVADSARPETISFLRRHGYTRIEAAKKGQNSVKEGVLFLQGYEIIIHPRCMNAIDEFSTYSYVTEEVVDSVTGLLTERPLPLFQDKKNHIIDPARYAVEQLRGVMRVRESQWG
jgi:phage terminase large subunit